MRVDEILALMRTQKVHVFGIGDSNQILGGHGWDHGIQYALSTAYQAFATGLISPNANNKNGNGVGYTFTPTGLDTGEVTGAPTELEAFAESTDGAMGNNLDYAYLADGSTQGDTAGVPGITLEQNSSIAGQDNDANLQHEVWYGTFPTGSGAFQPRARRNTSPFNSVMTGSPVISTNTGSYSLQKATTTLDAVGARAYDLEFGFGGPGGSDTIGPFFSPYQRIVNLDRTFGYAYTTLVFRGGEPTRVLASALQSQANTYLETMFTQLRTDEGANSAFLFTINSGLNDRTDTTNSVGPSPAVSNTGAGYRDNLEAIRTEILARCTAASINTDRVAFLILTSHAQLSTDTQLQAYRTAAAEMDAAYDDVRFVNLYDIWQPGSLTNFYLGGTDESHLEQVGYETLALAAISEAAVAPSVATNDELVAAIRADLERDGGLLDLAKDEIDKIPRLATAITAGGPVRKTPADVTGSNAIDETLTTPS